MPAKPKPGRRDVMVATCTLGQVRIEWALAFQECVMPMNRLRRTIVIKGMKVSDARNIAVEMAKRENCEFIFFWDDDVIPLSLVPFAAMVITMQQRSEIDILGGVYPIRCAVPEPIVMKEPFGGVWWGWEDGKVHRCYMTGTGFTMIRMKSLEKIKAQTYSLDAPDLPGEKIEITRYFFESGDFTPHPEQEADGWLCKCTDDFYFAQHCAKAGLKWYVHGQAICDQVDLDGTLYRVQNAKIDLDEGPSAQITPSITVTGPEEAQPSADPSEQTYRLSEALKPEVVVR